MPHFFLYSEAILYLQDLFTMRHCVIHCTTDEVIIPVLGRQGCYLKMAHADTAMAQQHCHCKRHLPRYASCCTQQDKRQAALSTGDIPHQSNQPFQVPTSI